jgi:hypothetical protein
MSEEQRDMQDGTESLRQHEAECAEGRTAPRVALQDIHDSISCTVYTTGDQLFPEDRGTYSERLDASVLTICLVVLKNGFTVLGKSAPASRENFDPELGKKLAFDNAVQQLWPLMGFSLKDRLHASAAVEATYSR